MITGTKAEYQSDAGSTKNIPYLTLTGKLWGIVCEYLWENRPRYKGTALYGCSEQSVFDAQLCDPQGRVKN